MAIKASEKNEIETPTKRLAVIRIRGRVGLRKPVVETLQFLRLHRKNHLVIIDNRPSYRGMLQKAKDYVTWGEIGADTIKLLLEKRGTLIGGSRVSDTIVKKYTNYNSIEEFATAIANFSAELSDLPKLKPVFRLHPPRGGFKGKIKRPVKDHGELGFRETGIEDLIKKMV
ncbi:MAG: 50S ribosomal protein L30 [Candidatus Helarchaeota archaeon]